MSSPLEQERDHEAAASASEEPAEAFTDEVAPAERGDEAIIAAASAVLALEDDPIEPTTPTAADGADRPPSSPATEATSSASGSSIGPSASVAAASPVTLKMKIQQMKEDQRALRLAGKTKARDIRNAERRSKRLKNRSEALTDADLNEVLRARAEAKANVGKGKAKAKSKAAGDQSRSPGLKRGSSSLGLGRDDDMFG